MSSSTEKLDFVSAIFVATTGVGVHGVDSLFNGSLVMSEWQKSRISRDSYYRDLGNGLVLKTFYDGKTWISSVWNMRVLKTDDNLQDSKDRAERTAIKCLQNALSDLQGEV
jgi:hypothetical protein